jgi:pyruvate-formate lyase-activating enzyme
MRQILPNLILSDSKGKLFVHPDLKMLGFSGDKAVLPEQVELIRMPVGSIIFLMPGHAPVGYDTKDDCEAVINRYNGKQVFPVSAFLIPGYTRLLLPAARKTDKNIVLPLWSYTAVGWAKGSYFVSAIRIDSRSRQKPHYYKNRSLLKNKIIRTLNSFTRNRLFRHLSNCAINYNCRAAQNLFFNRWEAPLPISPSCNAKCIGCLSLQDADCSAASHSRINFIPKSEEVSEVALFHLETAKEAIVSFGQGCEGEPLLQFDTLKKSITRIRKKTAKGTIHLNTNAYNSGYLSELARLGLNSVRISINSLQGNFYSAYYRPRGYKFEDVLKSIKTAKKSGLFVSLNLLVFPGLTDTPKEVSRLLSLLGNGYVDLLQLRNLCLDSDFYLNRIPRIKDKAIGVLKMINIIRRRVPHVRFGYFNLPKEKF